MCLIAVAELIRQMCQEMASVKLVPDQLIDTDYPDEIFWWQSCIIDKPAGADFFLTYELLLIHRPRSRHLFCHR